MSDAAGCLHDAEWTGIDGTSIADADKVWRCHLCGGTGTDGQLTAEKADEYARQLRQARDQLAALRAEIDYDRCVECDRPRDSKFHGSFVGQHWFARRIPITARPTEDPA